MKRYTWDDYYAVCERQEKTSSGAVWLECELELQRIEATIGKPIDWDFWLPLGLVLPFIAAIILSVVFK